MVETLGFNTTITLVLTCPPYVIAGAISIAVSWSSGRFNERTWHITISKLVAIFGFVLGAATMNMGARYFAMVVFATGTYGVNSIVLGWVGSTCGQTPEKKAVALSIVNTVANISFIWTPVRGPLPSRLSPFRLCDDIFADQCRSIFGTMRTRPVTPSPWGRVLGSVCYVSSALGS